MSGSSHSTNNSPHTSNILTNDRTAGGGGGAGERGGGGGGVGHANILNNDKEGRFSNTWFIGHKFNSHIIQQLHA